MVDTAETPFDTVGNLLVLNKIRSLLCLATETAREHAVHHQPNYVNRFAYIALPYMQGNY